MTLLDESVSRVHRYAELLQQSRRSANNVGGALTGGPIWGWGPQCRGATDDICSCRRRHGVRVALELAVALASMNVDPNPILSPHLKLKCA